MSVEAAFTHSSPMWLHVLSRSTGRETIWEIPAKSGLTTGGAVGALSERMVVISGTLSNKLDRHAVIKGAAAFGMARLAAPYAIASARRPHPKVLHA